MGERTQWHGHRLSPLADGESWLRGGERRPAPAERPVDELDPWPFAGLDGFEDSVGGSGGWTDTAPLAPARRLDGQPASAATPWRGGVLLALLGLAALITILVGRSAGSTRDPAPLPSPPSKVIHSLSRAHLTPVTLSVGDYLRFDLPAGGTYSTVLEQPGESTPVVEALTLPGQEPQLRADSTGTAVVEVMAEPTCPNAGGCPDQRKLLGGLRITVSG